MNGHALTSENTRRDRAGYRVCRECERAKNRAWYAKTKADPKAYAAYRETKRGHEDAYRERKTRREALFEEPESHAEPRTASKRRPVRQRPLRRLEAAGQMLVVLPAPRTSPDVSALPASCRCGAHWGGELTCHCATSGCHRNFADSASWQAHRPRGRCIHPAAVGLIYRFRAGYGVWTLNRKEPAR